VLRAAPRPGIPKEKADLASPESGRAAHLDDQKRSAAVIHGDRTRRPRKGTAMSCSQRKIEANRQNALKSTGPKTADGKASASRNALKHGLCAESPQVAMALEEDPAAYEAFAQEMLEDLQPRGPVQRTLAQRIVFVAWKLQRIPEIEARLFEHGEGQVQHFRRDEHGMRTPATVAECISEMGCNAYFGRLQMYEMRLERSFHAGLRQLERLKKLRNEANEETESEAQEPKNEAEAQENEPNEATAPEQNDATEPSPVPSHLTSGSSPSRELDAGQRRVDLLPTAAGSAALIRASVRLLRGQMHGH
jgi:hypothetical protein